jgi:GT2 family glycosyltransferase
MSGERPPDEVRRLADERSAARAARDYAQADELREQLRELGWEVRDSASGSSLRPALPPAAAGSRVAYARPEDLASLLGEPATLAASLVVVAEDHPQDLARFLRGLAGHPPLVSWELVMVANAPSFDGSALLGAANLEVEPVLLATTARLGWADAVNLGLRRVRGEVAVLLDTSLEPTGDFVTPLLPAFEDPKVGLAGPWGVTSPDLRQFAEATPGEVDAIEGYCLAIRRGVLQEVRSFDRRFRFYRNADLDFSFAVRSSGWRAVRTEPLPLVRHEHRGWTSLPEAERDRLSRRNFYRFLHHWGDRRDLLLRPGPHVHRGANQH